MKKSRIIIPALAMIAFSMAASISGAVAWFTATRTASIDAGTYAVVKTSANMNVTLTQGVGTTVSDQNGHVVTVGGVLTDGSFDHLNEKIYTPDDTGTKIKSVLPLRGEGAADASSLKRGETSDNPAQNIYTAITWDVKFSIAFTSGGDSIGLFLDCEEDTVSNAQVGRSRFEVYGGAAADTATGFRMAFVPKATSTNAVARVFADLQTSGNCKYVNSGTAGDALPAGQAYSGDLIPSSYNTALPESFNSLSDATSRVDYFGKFAYSAGATVDLEYTVVCWFEGTDPNITERSGMVLQSVVTHLQFKAINLPAA